jgi:hypothetical protein
LDFLEVAAIVGGIAALMSIGVSIGVYVTKIPSMQKEIDELKTDARNDRLRTHAKFEKHDEAIGEIEKSIVGIEHNIQTLVASSASNGVKLDRIFTVLADRPHN